MRRIMMIAATACMLAGCADPCQDAEELIRQAAQMPGAPEVQQSTYLRALKRCPESKVLVSQLVQQALGANAFNEAMPLLKALEEFNPEDGETLIMLGQVADLQGNAREALQHYVKARQALPDRSDLELSIAYAHVNLGQPDKAIEAFNAAKAKGADPGEIALRLGRLYLETGNLPKAKESFTEGLQRQPNAAYAHYGLGEILYQEGNLEQAKSSLEQAARLDPRFLEAHVRLGEIGMRMNDLALAINHNGMVVRLNPQDPRAYNNFAWVLFLNGQVQEAQANALQGLQMPGAARDPNLLSTLGHTFNAMREGAKANSIFADLINQRGDSPWVNFGLGKSFRLLGNENEAARYLAKALELADEGDVHLRRKLQQEGLLPPPPAEEGE